MKKYLTLACITTLFAGAAHAGVNCGTVTLKEAEQLDKWSRAIESEAKMALVAATLEVGHGDLKPVFFSLDGGGLITALQHGSAMSSLTDDLADVIAIRDKTTDTEAKGKIADYLNEQLLTLRTRANFAGGGFAKVRKYSSQYWRTNLENAEKASNAVKHFLSECTYR